MCSNLKVATSIASPGMQPTKQVHDKKILAAQIVSLAPPTRTHEGGHLTGPWDR